MFRAVESRKDRQWKGIEFKESRGNFPRERDRLSNIISLSEFIIYTSDPLRKNNRRNFLREKLQTVFRRKKESSRKFLADECETACTRFDAWKEAGYTRTNVQLYTNPRKRRYRERERERGRKGTRYPKGGHERAGRHRYIGAHGEATSRVHLDLRLVCSATCASLHVTFLTSAPTCSPLTQVARATGSEQIRTPVNCPAATEDECR